MKQQKDFVKFLDTLLNDFIRNKKIAPHILKDTYKNNQYLDLAISKLLDDGYIQKITPLRDIEYSKHGIVFKHDLYYSITDKGKLFILNGGYKKQFRIQLAKEKAMSLTPIQFYLWLIFTLISILLNIILFIKKFG